MSVARSTTLILFSQGSQPQAANPEQGEPARRKNSGGAATGRQSRARWASENDKALV